MKDAATGTATVSQKVVGAIKETLALALYLYICLLAVVLLKSAVLREVGVDSVIWGTAAIKALLLAKFMLIGRELKLGKRFRDRALIWPILFHALIFLAFLLVLTAIEEILVGAIHGRPLSQSLAHVVGPTVFEGAAVCLVFFLILIPYSAFDCLQDVLGERETLRLFFVDGSRAVSAQGYAGQ